MSGNSTRWWFIPGPGRGIASLRSRTVLHVVRGTGTGTGGEERGRSPRCASTGASPSGTITCRGISGPRTRARVSFFRTWSSNMTGRPCASPPRSWWPPGKTWRPCVASCGHGSTIRSRVWPGLHERGIIGRRVPPPDCGPDAGAGSGRSRRSSRPSRTAAWRRRCWRGFSTCPRRAPSIRWTCSRTCAAKTPMPMCFSSSLRPGRRSSGPPRRRSPWCGATVSARPPWPVRCPAARPTKSSAPWPDSS